MAKVRDGNIVLTDEQSLIVNSLTAVSKERKGQFSSIVLDSAPGVNITGVSIDGALAANSDSLVPTQQAVKTYVDNNVINQVMDLASLDNTVQGGIRFHNVTAGEAIAAWSLIYKKRDQSQNIRYFAYSANGTDKNLLPIAMSINSASAAGELIDLVSGPFFFRASVYAQTYTSTVKVYASTVPGQITIVPPASPGDKRLIVGYLWGSERFIMSLPVMVDVEVPAEV